jgi:hypothetical protein
MWLTTQSPPIENALHRIMRVIIFPHDDQKKDDWIIISSKVPMCVQTHQVTTGPNGITSGLHNIWQDFQNPPVLCNWLTPVDLTRPLPLGVYPTHHGVSAHTNTSRCPLLCCEPLLQTPINHASIFLTFHLLFSLLISFLSKPMIHPNS